MKRFTATLRTYSTHVFLITGFVLFAVAPAVFLHTSRARAASFTLPPGSIPLRGDAWAGFLVSGSSNYTSGPGWISFSGTAGNGDTYGVYENPTTGALAGYAWSTNYGWISFNAADVSGCTPVPANGICAPTVNLTTGEITGWARDLFAGGGSGGWIHLSGKAQDGSSNPNCPDGASYCVVQSPSCSNGWSGYAWGDTGTNSGSGTSIGWINTSGTATDGSHYGVTCAAPPITVSCKVSALSGDTGTSFLWKATASGGSGSPYKYTWTGDTSPASPPVTTAAPTNDITTQYTTTGTKNVSVTVTDTQGNTSPTVYCINSTGSGAPTSPGSGTGVTVYQAPTLSASTPVINGGSSTLAWNSNGNSCLVAGQAGENNFSSTAASSPVGGQSSGKITIPGCATPPCY